MLRRRKYSMADIPGEYFKHLMPVLLAAIVIVWLLLIPCTSFSQEVGLPSDVTGPGNNGGEDQPLWEVGVAGFGGYTADYPAAGENHFNGIGAPFVIYRGDILRLGDGSLARGRFIKTDRIEFDVSFNGSFPVDSDDNIAREGMPNLDFLGEVGPQLTMTLAKPARGTKINLAIPVRAVFSTDLSNLEFRGIMINPKLIFRHQNPSASGFRINLSLGPIFATTELMEYFYGVEPQFARSDRPVFDADAGYLGTELNLGFSKHFSDRIRGFVGSRLGYYGGSANEKSPLYRKDINASFGLGLAWSFYQSDRKGRGKSVQSKKNKRKRPKVFRRKNKSARYCIRRSSAKTACGQSRWDSLPSRIVSGNQ
jgi:MipA family protein